MDDHAIRAKYKTIPGLEFNIPEEDFHQFYSSDNLKLHTYRFPSKFTRAVMINFHGLHSYCNNHAIVGKYLSEINCDFVGYDQRGHGKSDGTPALLPDLSQLLADACKFVEEISQLYKGLPIFLTGGSMGGALSLAVSMEYPGLVKGVIVMNPAIAGKTRCEKVLNGFLNCIGKCCPGLGLVKSINKKWCKGELYSYLEENPFNYSEKVKLRTVVTISKLMRYVRDKPHLVKCPVAIIVGLKDTIVNPKHSEAFFHKLAEDENEFWKYEKIKHAMIYHREIYSICEKIRAWVHVRIEKLNN